MQENDEIIFNDGKCIRKDTAEFHYESLFDLIKQVPTARKLNRIGAKVLHVSCIYQYGLRNKLYERLCNSEEIDLTKFDFGHHYKFFFDYIFGPANPPLKNGFVNLHQDDDSSLIGLCVKLFESEAKDDNFYNGIFNRLINQHVRPGDALNENILCQVLYRVGRLENINEKFSDFITFCFVKNTKVFTLFLQSCFSYEDKLTNKYFYPRIFCCLKDKISFPKNTLQMTEVRIFKTWLLKCFLKVCDYDSSNIILEELKTMKTQINSDDEWKDVCQTALEIIDQDFIKSLRSYDYECGYFHSSCLEKYKEFFKKFNEIFSPQNNNTL